MPEAAASLAGMTGSVTLPVWLFVLILLFAAVTFASHFLFPSVRWFFRRRAEKIVARLNERLERPIQPFKLARRYDLIQRLIYDPDVTEAVLAHAAEYGLREDVAFQDARRYAREIVPAFSATAYFGFAIRAARWLSNALYRVDVADIDERALEAIDRDATVIFVMNHRSNMDYVLVTYLAANRSALSYAVGEWARVWPLSALIRAMGAYFIRRKSRTALYRKVLEKYVQMATQGGVAQAIFPEGGLSLDGALHSPKVGLIKYIAEGSDLKTRDVVFVPVALNYDRVLEDRILIDADQRGDRRFRAGLFSAFRNALALLWRRATGRFRSFGLTAVRFGRPLSMRAQPELVARPEALGREIMSRIADAVPILPVPLVSYLLLTRGPLTRTDLEVAFRKVEIATEYRLFLPRRSRGYAVQFALERLKLRKLVIEDGETYRPSENAEPILRFYANSVRHLLTDFADAA
ncbi:glycerol-3-phosphate O-acyltransferase [Roseivivax halotolerans]|jgi:glycerol-3-phosphate O-acyltransferase|uniref:Glycerol-3-phosphate acyltransferase n=2 Tax=Roseobacteraceae TaxID=2854170 RepID=A0A1I5UTY1_9RHOB|nr:Glycerol-3-phosphate acyltransferase [Roseivivax sp. THAF30]SFP98487.1 glycerol-3-phosphate O-acyltransferase [Roseivivax halotolerans]